MTDQNGFGRKTRLGLVQFATYPASMINGLPVQHPPTGFDALRPLAVARAYLDNFDRITGYWVGMGLKLAQAALSYQPIKVWGQTSPPAVERPAKESPVLEENLATG